MAATVDIQYATTTAEIPTAEQLELWARAALQDAAREVELVIRLVDEQEAAQLNRQWRKIPRATNVLAFAGPESAATGAPRLLGDVVICAPLATRESQAQGKSRDAHWAHLVIHGILHLRGFDHIDARDAERMEALEAKLLKEFDYDDPYL